MSKFGWKVLFNLPYRILEESKFSWILGKETKIFQKIPNKCINTSIQSMVSSTRNLKMKKNDIIFTVYSFSDLLLW